MLQKIDKDRLDEVLEILSRGNFRFANAEVVRRTGENKGNVSSYLSGKKPMSDNFYTTFMSSFKNPADKNEKDTHTLAQNGTEVQDLHTLIESNATQSQALKVVADTNALLASMLKNSMAVKPIENELEDILSGMTATMRGVVDSLAEIGAGKKFPSVQAAADAIHKHVSAQHRKKLTKGSLHTSGK